MNIKPTFLAHDINVMAQMEMDNWGLALFSVSHTLSSSLAGDLGTWEAFI